MEELNGSDSSSLQLITEGSKSHHLMYKDVKFVYSNPTNGNFIYKCHEIRCPKKIKVDKERRKIIGVAGVHENHSVNTPSPKCNRSNSLPGLSGGKVTSTPLTRKDKSKDSHPDDQDQSTAGDQQEAYITVLDIDQTRGAIQTTNHKTEINPEAHDNHVPETIDTENIYKIRYEEMFKLKDSLIDKILEKERCILKQNTEIRELRTKVAVLERPNTELLELREELNHANSLTKQLMTTISTLEAGWEVDKKELDKLQDKPQPEVSISLRPKAVSTVQPPHCQTQQSGPTMRTSIQVTVIGDSHVRRMENVLTSKLPSHYDVKCYFKPGSKVAELDEISTREHNHQDIIILFSGTNDVSKTSMKAVKESFVKIIDKNKHCCVGVVLVPLKRNTCNFNSHIKDFNAQLIDFFKDKPVYLIDPTKILDTNDYCNDNLHLNKIGKNKLGKLICDKILKTGTSEQENKKVNMKTTPKSKHDQRRVKFTITDYSQHQNQNRYSGVRGNNRYRGPSNKYNRGYNDTYNNRYNGHNYNYNRRYHHHYIKPRSSYHQYPHSSQYNRTYHNTNRYGYNRVQHNSDFTRRYHSDGGWDSARDENSVGQNRFFRKY
uniref:Uncharacterized protein n=1 Tax=Cacopsylla melanoneura TaxID=428564 RepID=A0A8D8SQG4_9HEMI